MKPAAAALSLLMAACATAPPAADAPGATATQQTTTAARAKAPAKEPSAEATRATLSAELLLQEGDVAGAAAELRAAVQHDPSSSYLRLRLGEALLLLGDAEGADAAAADAVRLAGDDDDGDDDAGREERVAALRLRAVTREQLGDDEGSIAALRRALETRPDRQASAMLAERLVRKGELSAAEAVVEQWMTAEPGAVDGWVALARVFAERGEIDRAFAHLHKALALQPDDGDALLLRRDLQLALGRFDGAAADVVAWARARGDGPEVRGALLAGLALKDPAEARLLAQGWLDEDGGDQSRLLVADAFERAGLVDDAIAALAAATTPRALLSLEHARLLLQRREPEAAARLACAPAARPGALEERLYDYAVALCGRAEADAGAADDAVARLLMAAKDRPQSARLLDALRSVTKRAAASRQAAARQHLEAVVADAGAADDVVVSAAFALAAVHEGGLARDALQKRLAKKPLDRDLVFAFARLLVDEAADGAAGAGDVRGGVELVERLLEREGADVDTLNFLAFTIADRSFAGGAPAPSRADEARRWAWRAVLLEPLNGYVLDTWGWALLAAGDVDEAVAVLRRADRLSPGEGEIWFHLATALSHKKDTAAAKEALAKARSLLSKDDPLLPRLDRLESELS